MVAVTVVVFAGRDNASAQLLKPQGITPPPPSYSLTQLADTAMMPFDVQQTVPVSYGDLMEAQFGYDLSTPSNISTYAEYDPATNTYVVHTQLGKYDITTPFILNPKQYNDWQFREAMNRYYQERNRQMFEEQATKEPF
ncbi:MAG: hypothetical protein K2M80_04960, partial [Muribaculaceae bacterium]|nr:hypothetical protein [Muribaculaceae bacterium]